MDSCTFGNTFINLSGIHQNIIHTHTHRAFSHKSHLMTSSIAFLTSSCVLFTMFNISIPLCAMKNVLNLYFSFPFFALSLFRLFSCFFLSLDKHTNDYIAALQCHLLAFVRLLSYTHIHIPSLLVLMM